MSQWIAGIYLGHNAGVCLLKDGEIIFSIEEERLSKSKHDGGPILSLMKILDYKPLFFFINVYEKNGYIKNLKYYVSILKL